VLDINAISILLGIVSLIITTVGFFASLYFYRHGVQLSNAANDALVKLEEKLGAIQTQVGGMFEKTLDAAIGGRSQVVENITEVQRQLETAKASIVEQATREMGSVGQKEGARLLQIVESQLSRVQRRVEATREIAEENALGDLEPSGIAKFSKHDLVVLRVLARIADWVRLKDIARSAGLPLSVAARSLESLQSRHLIHIQPSIFEGHSSDSELTASNYVISNLGRVVARQTRYLTS
jgi:hypothetical protein